MKREYFGIIAVFVILGGCKKEVKKPEFPVPKPNALCEIKSWSQDYDSLNNEWGDVRVEYEIMNTGEVRIGWYKVYFKIVCEDGSEYMDSDSDFDLWEGESKIRFPHLDVVPNKKAVSVEITKVDLSGY